MALLQPVVAGLYAPIGSQGKRSRRPHGRRGPRAAATLEDVLLVLLWLILFVLAWPVALLALLLYPVLWLLLLPFRIFGIAVEGVLQTLRAILLLPARILSLGRS